jgi:hypothetical protein
MSASALGKCQYVDARTRAQKHTREKMFCFWIVFSHKVACVQFYINNPLPVAWYTGDSFSNSTRVWSDVASNDLSLNTSNSGESMPYVDGAPQLNGHAIVRFDGNVRCSVVMPEAVIATNTPSDYTFFFVFRRFSADVVSRMPFFFRAFGSVGSSTTQEIVFYSYLFPLSMEVEYDTDRQGVPLTPLTNWHLLTYRFQGGVGATLRINGSIDESFCTDDFCTVWPLNAALAVIGADSLYQHIYFDGYIAEMIYVQSALNDTSMCAVEAALASKYALTSGVFTTPCRPTLAPTPQPPTPSPTPV